MNPLLKAFLEICLFRAGPQILPANRFLLGLMLLIHFLLGAVLALFAMGPGRSLLSALIGTLTMVAAVHAVLTLAGKSARTVQALTALAGGEMVIGLLALPVSVWYYGDIGSQTIPALLSLGLMAWSLGITAHILRHAIETSQWNAFMLAVGYMVLAFILTGFVHSPAN